MSSLTRDQATDAAEAIALEFYASATTTETFPAAMGRVPDAIDEALGDDTNPDTFLWMWFMVTGALVRWARPCNQRGEGEHQAAVRFLTLTPDGLAAGDVDAVPPPLRALGRFLAACLNTDVPTAWALYEIALDTDSTTQDQRAQFLSGISHFIAAGARQRLTPGGRP